MFLIKNTLTQEVHNWGNDIADDFLRFIPDTLDVAKEDLAIYHCECNAIMDDAITDGGVFREAVDIDNATFKLMKKTAGMMAGELVDDVPLEEDSVDLALTEFASVPLASIAWPYDESGNFLGNNEA